MTNRTEGSSLSTSAGAGSSQKGNLRSLRGCTHLAVQGCQPAQPFRLQKLKVNSRCNSGVATAVVVEHMKTPRPDLFIGGGHSFHPVFAVCGICGMTRQQYERNNKPQCAGRRRGYERFTFDHDDGEANQ